MRLARPRFTVRRMMVGVAAVGIVLAAWRLKLRHDRAIVSAERYRQMGTVFIAHGRWEPDLAEIQAREEEEKAENLRLAEECRRAAWKPWVTLPPELPPPPTDAQMRSMAKKAEELMRRTEEGVDHGKSQ